MNLFKELNFPGELEWVVSKYYSAPKLDNDVRRVLYFGLKHCQEGRLRKCKYMVKNQNKRYDECGARIFEIGKRYCKKHIKHDTQKYGVLSCSSCNKLVIREDMRCWNCEEVRRYRVIECFPWPKYLLDNFATEPAI